MEQEEPKIIIFVDPYCRITIGRTNPEKSDDTTLVVDCPALLHLQQENKGNGQTEAKAALIPYLPASQFLAKPTASWSFNRAQCVFNDSGPNEGLANLWGTYYEGTKKAKPATEIVQGAPKKPVKGPKKAISIID